MSRERNQLLLEAVQESEAADGNALSSDSKKVSPTVSWT
jgi:hypothetical protein